MTDSEGEPQLLESHIRDMAPQLLAALKTKDLNTLDADTTARLLKEMLQQQGIFQRRVNPSTAITASGTPFLDYGGANNENPGASRKSRRPQAQKPLALKAFSKVSSSQVGYLCIADEFNLHRMKEYYDRQKLKTSLEFDVLSVHKPAVDGNAKRDKDAFSIFLFKYGSVVFWGTPVSFKQVIEPDFLLAPRPNSEIAHAMEGRYPVELVATNFPVYCTYEIVYEEASEQSEVSKQHFERTLKEMDHFQLPSRNSDELKLCISHALAQSAKIEYMELKIQELTQKCKPLPRELKDKGSVTIAERSLLQLRGEVLYYRLMLKSGSDLLDEPELFWEHEQLKPYFYVTKEFFDINARVRVLDAKLDASNEILGMLSDQFSQRHSSRLEWIVIWLVLVEVIIGALELMLDLKPWSRALH